MDRETIAEALLEAACIRFGTFTYASGDRGPIYVDLRRLVSHPAAMATVCRGLTEKLRDLDEAPEILLGAATAGLPLTSPVSLETGIPMCYARKTAKGHGTGSRVEGCWSEGQRAILVDDLVTTGASKAVFAEAGRDAGLVVDRLLVVLDRRARGNRELEDLGLELHALLTLSELLDVAEARGAASAEDLERARAWWTEAGR